MAKAKAPKCPVCGRDMPNKGALASHLRLSKDSAHVAHRGAPPAAPPAAPEAPKAPEPPAVVAPEPVPAPPAPAPVAPPVVQEERQATLVSFQPPAVVQPLAGAQQKGSAPTGAQAAPSPTGEAKPEAPTLTVSELPLEPFLAAATAQVVNAFALDPAKGDRPMTQQEVGATGFPKALEASVRKYYPDLPLDHPLLLLGISGTALVAAVKAHRAPRTPDASRTEPGAAPSGAGGQIEAPSVTAEAGPPPEAPRGASPEAALWAEMVGATP